VKKDPRTRRPELLLLGAGDHFELGNAIRSAAGLGWERAFVEDRHRVWFGCNREIRFSPRSLSIGIHCLMRGLASGWWFCWFLFMLFLAVREVSAKVRQKA